MPETHLEGIQVMLIAHCTMCHIFVAEYNYVELSGYCRRAPLALKLGEFFDSFENVQVCVVFVKAPSPTRLLQGRDVLMRVYLTTLIDYLGQACSGPWAKAIVVRVPRSLFISFLCLPFVHLRCSWMLHQAGGKDESFCAASPESQQQPQTTGTRTNTENHRRRRYRIPTSSRMGRPK